MDWFANEITTTHVDKHCIGVQVTRGCGQLSRKSSLIVAQDRNVDIDIRQKNLSIAYFVAVPVAD
jgi:hypothetical protein